jgi:hypothetical protein
MAIYPATKKEFEAKAVNRGLQQRRAAQCTAGVIGVAIFGAVKISRDYQPVGLSRRCFKSDRLLGNSKS